EGTKFLGIRKGLDRKAPAALVLMTPENDNDFNGLGILKYIVPVIPYTSAKEMAGNFGISTTKFVFKSIVKTDRQNDGRLSEYAMRHNKHIYLSESDKTLRRLQKSKLVAASLTAEQRKPLD